ncbi:MAG TPA: pyruvate dehydrogenase (acetyl-transferring) E1 component subunit alpha [Armatimonadota bacterium]|nr:pyruvate dehydrogenase (acetyl-transferring) E1 component subunit alpha [Armatimonadota bacterium]
MAVREERLIHTKEELLEMYRQMLLIRAFEEKAAEMYTKGKIGGFLHLYSGQEAVAVGFISVLREDDYVVGAYREHGQCIAKGAEPKHVMAELYGKATGVSKGKGGSMHMFDVKRGFLGGHGIVGGGMPIAIGVGLAIKYRKTDQVCVCFFGDGAVNEGSFHEALNMVALWNLPVIYVLENNMYAMGTAVYRASSIPDLIRRASCYDIEREQVDGMDLLAVREVAERAVRKAREDREPRFIEAITYRFRGHSMADPAAYRTKEEVEEWRKRDPILRMEGYLKDNRMVTDDDIKAMRAEVDAEIQEAVDFAESSTFPPPDALYEDIYA